MSASSPSDRIRLVAKAADAFTEIQIVDGNMRRIPLEENLGSVSIELPRGIYEVNFGSGESIRQEVVVLTNPSKSITVEQAPDDTGTKFKSAVPIHGSSADVGDQLDEVISLSQSDTTRPAGMTGGSGLVLYINGFKPGDTRSDGLRVSIHDLSGAQLGDTAGAPGHGPIGVHLDLDQGAYVIRMYGPDRLVEQIVHTRDGWQTQAFLSCAQSADGTQIDPDSMSVHMGRGETGFQSGDETQLAEKALRALARGHAGAGKLVSGEQSEMFHRKFDNPMLGLYASLLHLRRRRINMQLMKEVFFNLANLLGGHPDVIAIGWAIILSDQKAMESDEIREKLDDLGQATVPPMLRESWKHLIHATLYDPEIIQVGTPASGVSDRIIERGAWLRWEGRLPETAQRSTIGRIARSVNQVLIQPSIYSIAKSGLKADIPKFIEYVSENEDVWPLIDSRHFTRVEKQIATFLFPPLDPTILRITGQAQKLKQRMVEQARKDFPTELDMLRALRIPAGRMFLSLLSLYSKCKERPVTAGSFVLRETIEWEAQDNGAVEKALVELAKRDSTISPPDSKTRVNLMQLWYLRRYGSLSNLSVGPTSIEEIATLLSDAGFTIDREDRPPMATDVLMNLRNLFDYFESIPVLSDRFLTIDEFLSWLEDKSPLMA